MHMPTNSSDIMIPIAVFSHSLFDTCAVMYYRYARQIAFLSRRVCLSLTAAAIRDTMMETMGQGFSVLVSLGLIALYVLEH